MTPDDPLDAFLGTCRHLRVDRASGLPKPYKPAMVLAAILLLHKGRFADNALTLDELRSAFFQVLAVVAPSSPPPSDVRLPFRHLASDGVWDLVAKPGDVEALWASVALGAPARQILRHVVFARLQPDVFARLVGSTAHALRAVLAVYESFLPVFRLHGMPANEGLHTLMQWLSGSAFVSEEGDRPFARSLYERSVEAWLESHWADTPFASQGLTLTGGGRQVLTNVNTIDLLAHDPTAGAWCVLELKRQNTSDAAVGQLARYMTWVTERKAGGMADRVTGALVTDAVSEKLRASVAANARMQLWRYDEGLRLERVG